MAGDEFEGHLSAIIDVLDRRLPIDALGALAAALQPITTSSPLSETAIGLDSSAVLRIPPHSKYELVADYLAGVHQSALVLPGQVVQEFWNNHLEVIATLAQPLKTNFGALRTTVEKIDPDLVVSVKPISDALDTFDAEHGQVYDQAMVAKTAAMLGILNGKAIVPFVPRLEFHDIAAQRKMTKTPPGFKDPGDGDFYVWADFLLGLSQAKAAGHTMSRVVFVTNDQKKDWSRKETAHPILAAEVKSLTGASFETWSLQKLVSAISAEMGG